MHKKAAETEICCYLCVLKNSGELKLIYSQYRELQSFAQFGSDLDADTKARLALGERIVEVLKQKRNSPVRVGCQVAIIYAVTNGYLDSVPVEKVKDYEARLYETLETKAADLLISLEAGNFDQKERDGLKNIPDEMSE